MKFKKSQQLLQRSLNVIPIGSQTFSKSYLQYPKGLSPLFLKKGLGSYVWDVDDNKYIDLVNGLLPIVLGYCDTDVDNAIKNQLEKGIVFSLSTELEIKLAEKLIYHIPSAEKVRFGKNGSDATSAAIRLARAYTKRDRVAICGYHGWHDWYIGSTTRNIGVPSAVSELSHRFKYNDIDSLQKLFRNYKNEFAAVIMEPMNTEIPTNNFLNEVQLLSKKNGALFILDEIITGFRYDLGGAQKLFGLTPDLSTFGKSMGNGMPISAIVGKAEIMDLMNDIFYSGTFGGEALSLSASLAVIKKMETTPVIEHLWKLGKYLSDSVIAEIKNKNLSDVFSITGMAPWMIVTIHDRQPYTKEFIKTIFMTEMLNQGILIQSSHNISFAHSIEDCEKIIEAYSNTLTYIANIFDGIKKVELESVIKPTFKVR